MIKTVRENAAQRGRSASDDVLQRLLRKGHLGRRVNAARSQRPCGFHWTGQPVRRPGAGTVLAALAALSDADACVFDPPLSTDTATPLCCPRRLSPPSVRRDVAGGSSRRARKMKGIGSRKKASLQQEAACLAPLSSLHGSPLRDL